MKYRVTCYNNECRQQFIYDTDHPDPYFILRLIPPKEKIVKECPYCHKMNTFEIDNPKSYSLNESAASEKVIEIKGSKPTVDELKRSGCQID